MINKTSIKVQIRHVLRLYHRIRHACCRDHNLALNNLASGDTNTGIRGIAFTDDVAKQLRNMCKLTTFFVKYHIDERWMKIFIAVDFPENTSQALSMERYYEWPKIDEFEQKFGARFGDNMSSGLIHCRVHPVIFR